MMKKGMKIAGLLFALVLALGGFAACNASNQTEQQKPGLPQSILLSGFESDRELLTMIFSNIHAKVEVSDEHVTDGTNSAKMTIYGKLSNDGTYYKDNDFYIIPGNAFLNKMDYSDVVGYSIDVFNAGDKPIDMAFGYNHLLMNSDTYLIGKRTLVPGANHLTFEINNNAVKTFVDVTAIKDFAFYVEGRDVEDDPSVLYFDNFRAEVLPHTSQGGEPNEIIDFSRPEDIGKFAMFGNFTSLLRGPLFELNSDLRYVLSGKNSMKVTFNAKKGNKEEVDCPGFRTCDDMFKIPDTYDLSKTYLHFDMYNDTDEEITVRIAMFSHIASDYFSTTVAIQPHSWAASGNQILLSDVDDVFVGNGLGNLMSVAFEVIGLKEPGSSIYFDSLTLTDELGNPATPKPRLSAPVLSVDGTTVSWNAVENASGYSVQVNNEAWSKPQTETSYILDRSTAGNYTVRVKALGDDKHYRDSDEIGITVLVTEKLGTPMLAAEHNSVNWNAVDHATGYQVKVDDGEWSEVQTELSYSLEGVSPGAHIVSVIAVSDSDIYTQSDEATITVNAVLQLAAPVLSVDGTTVSWNAVENASKYSVRINDATPVEQTETFYVLTVTAGGEYVIKVTAVSDDDNVEDSSAAQAKIIVEEKLGMPVLITEGATVSWPAVANADGYCVKVDDGAWSAMQTETTYMLGKTPGTYTVSVKAVADEEWYLDSDEAQTLVTVPDITAPKVTYSEFNKVKKNTPITLSADGIADYLTVTDFSGFDLTYCVVKYGALGAEKLVADTKNFTVQGGEYYEVYVTATDKSDKKNTSRAYLVFAAEDIADRLNTWQDCDADLWSDGTLNVTKSGEFIFRGYEFKDRYEFAADEFGNTRLKLKAGGDQFQVMFLYDAAKPNIRFTVRLETELTNLSGNLLTVEGITITADDIGKTFVINTTLSQLDGNVSYWLDVNVDAIKNRDVWVVIDNIETFAASALTVSSENDRVEKDSGANIIFTAEELGIRGADCLGNELSSLKVTEVKFNGVVNAGYIDGYTLANAPEGIYEITFTATDRYGSTATKTITVIVGKIPPEISVTNTDNYVNSDTVITFTDNGITDYLTVTGHGGDLSVTWRVIKNGVEELTSVNSITVRAGEYYEVYVTATEENVSSKSYILFADSALNDVLKTLNGKIETAASGIQYVSCDGEIAFGINAGKISEAITDGNTEIYLSGVTTGLQFFLPYATATSVSISFSLRIEGTFEGEGALVTIYEETVTVVDVGKEVVVAYNSTPWFSSDLSGVPGIMFTLDSVTVSELFLSDSNAKIYIDNIVIRAA